MSFKSSPYAPFASYVTARREHLLPGQYYTPFSSKTMEPARGTAYAFFDSDKNPCQDIVQAVYVVHDMMLPTPPGFIRISQAVNGYGRPLAIPEYATPEDEVSAWVSSIRRLMRRSATARDATEETLQTDRLQRDAVNSNLIGLPPIPTQQRVDSESHVDEEEDGYQLKAGGDGYYLKPLKSGRALRTTNYLIELKEVRHCIGASGEELSERRKLLFCVRLMDTGRTIELETEYQRLNGIVELVKQKVPEGIIYRNSRILIEQLDILLRTSLALCAHTYEYAACGWARLPNKELAYVHDDTPAPADNIYYRSGFSFKRGSNSRTVREVVEAGFSVLNLASDLEKSVIPFLWAHLGLLWTLFAKAGYPPRALLYLSGVSGSLKTAVCKMLFNFTAIPEQDIPASFRDTSASMEISIEQYKDRVLLVDDFCPAANKAARRTMEQTLESLIRFYGDGNTKSRADPRMDKVYVKKPEASVPLLVKMLQEASPAVCAAYFYMWIKQPLKAKS